MKAEVTVKIPPGWYALIPGEPLWIREDRRLNMEVPQEPRWDLVTAGLFTSRVTPYEVVIRKVQNESPGDE